MEWPMSSAGNGLPVDLQTDRPHPARVYDYLLGGKVAYIDADLRNTDSILGADELNATLDLKQPVALLLIAILHFIGDEDDPQGIVDRLLAALPPGSFLALSHLTGDFDAAAWEGV